MAKNPYILQMQKIVDTAVGKPKFSYPMYQNAPRPTDDTFAAIRIIAIRSPCYDEVKHYEEGGKFYQETTGNREVMIDVLFNRDSGFEDITNFDNSFFRPDVEAVCDEVGMHLLRKKPTNLRNRSLESNWEIRTGITCIMSTIQTDKVEIQSIEQFNISGSFTDEVGTTNLTTNIQKED